MRLRIVGRILSVIPIAALYMILAPAADANECSTASMAGGWGFTLTGTALFPSPIGSMLVSAVGTLTADNQGNFNGTEARSAGGGYADETVTGNWTVSSNCTGTFYAKIYEGGVLVRISVASIVIDDDSKELRLVQKSLTLPGTNGTNGTDVPVVITLEAKRLFPNSGNQF